MGGSCGLRKGMVNDNRTKFSELVEVNETHIGGPVKGKKGGALPQECIRALWPVRWKFWSTPMSGASAESEQAGSG